MEIKNVGLQVLVYVALFVVLPTIDVYLIKLSGFLWHKSCYQKNKERIVMVVFALLVTSFLSIVYLFFAYETRNQQLFTIPLCTVGIAAICLSVVEIINIIYCCLSKSAKKRFHNKMLTTLTKITDKFVKHRIFPKTAITLSQEVSDGQLWEMDIKENTYPYTDPK